MAAVSFVREHSIAKTKSAPWFVLKDDVDNPSTERYRLNEAKRRIAAVSLQ